MSSVLQELGSSESADSCPNDDHVFPAILCVLPVKSGSQDIKQEFIVVVAIVANRFHSRLNTTTFNVSQH